MRGVSEEHNWRRTHSIMDFSRIVFWRVIYIFLCINWDVIFFDISNIQNTFAGGKRASETHQYFFRDTYWCRDSGGMSVYSLGNSAFFREYRVALYCVARVCDRT